MRARRLDAPALRTYFTEVLGPKDDGAWGLDRLAVAATYLHPDLKLARARWKVATGAEVTAGRLPNPTLGLPVARSISGGPASPWLFTSALSFLVEFGQRGLREERAIALADAARLDVVDQAWRLRTRVRAALVALANAQARAVVLEEKAAIEDEVAGMLDAQARAGEVAEVVAARARITAQDTHIALADAHAAVAVARADLAAAVGVPSAALSGIPISARGLDALPAPGALAQAREQALLDHPALLASLARYAAEDAGLRLEIRNQFPSLRIGPGYYFNRGDHRWGLGISLTLPIFDQNQGPIAEARARREAAGAAFDALQQNLLWQIERATADVEGRQASLNEREALYARLRAQLETAEAMLAAGEISPLQLSTRRLEVVTADLARVDARAQLRVALGALEAGLDGPVGLPESFWRAAPRGAEGEDT